MTDGYGPIVDSTISQHRSSLFFLTIYLNLVKFLWHLVEFALTNPFNNLEMDKKKFYDHDHS